MFPGSWSVAYAARMGVTARYRRIVRMLAMGVLAFIALGIVGAALPVEREAFDEGALFHCAQSIERNDAPIDCHAVCPELTSLASCSREVNGHLMFRFEQPVSSTYVDRVELAWDGRYWNPIDARWANVPWYSQVGEWVVDALVYLLGFALLGALVLMLVLRLPPPSRFETFAEDVPSMHRLQQQVTALGFSEVVRLRDHRGLAMILHEHPEFDDVAAINLLTNGMVYVEFLRAFTDGRSYSTHNARGPRRGFRARLGHSVIQLPEVRSVKELLELHHAHVRALGATESLRLGHQEWAAHVIHVMREQLAYQVQQGLMKEKSNGSFSVTFFGALRFVWFVGPPMSFFWKLYDWADSHLLEADLRQGRVLPESIMVHGKAREGAA